MIDLTIPMQPTPKGRPRLSMANGRAIIYTPKKTKEAEELMKNYASLKFNSSPLQGALIVFVNYYFKRPKTVKRDHHTVKPDLDNLNKTIDAFNGILWGDDSQIVSLVTSKSYTDSESYIEIKVTEYNKAIFEKIKSLFSFFFK